MNGAFGSSVGFPIEESGFGHAKLAGDGAETPAVGAQNDKTLFGFLLFFLFVFMLGSGRWSVLGLGRIWEVHRQWDGWKGRRMGRCNDGRIGGCDEGIYDFRWS